MKTLFPSIRRRLPLSHEGLGWLVLTVAILVTGLVKGINLITLLACMFLAIGLVNVALAWRQVVGLRIKRQTPDFVVAGVKSAWLLTVSQDRPRKRTGLTIVENWPATWIVDVAAVPEQTIERWSVPDRRGVATFGPIVVRSSHPFGLARFERPASDGATVYVAPRLGQLERGLLRRWLSQRQSTAGAIRSRPIRQPTGQMEFHGLRTFRPGDSPRLIHWRTSARRGELMVREFEEYPNDDLVLVVDLALPESKPTETFERMLSLAATVVWEWCRQKGDRLTVVLVGERTSNFSGATGADLRTDVMRALAAAEPFQRGRGDVVADLRTSSTTAHLLLAVGASELVDSLNTHLRHVLAVVDLAAGDDRDFFQFDP